MSPVQRTFAACFPAIPLIFFTVGSVSGAVTAAAPVIACGSKTSVPRAGEARIVLETIPNYGNPVTFEISTPPRHGVLSVPRNLSDHTSEVIYRHDGSGEVQEDQFFFRASSPGLAKSAPCRVLVEILPPPARIRIDPVKVEFGKVPLGEARRAKISLVNDGGAKAVGRLVLPKGFSAPGGDTFALPENGETTMIVEFRPEEERMFSGRAMLVPPQESSPQELSGEGVGRFEVLRSGDTQWNITNISSVPIMVSLASTPPFGPLSHGDVPRDILLEPHSAQLLSFPESDHVADQSAGTNSPLITFRDGLSTRSLRLPISLGTPPIMVHAVSPAFLGTFPRGESIPVRFSVGNRSQTEKRLEWSLLSPRREGAGGFHLGLAGGESREVVYNWNPDLPGNQLLRIEVKDGERPVCRLDWSAIVTPSPEQERGISAVPVERPKDPMPLPGTGEEVPSDDFPKVRLPMPAVEALEWSVTRPLFGSPRLLITWSPRKGAYRLPELVEKMLVMNRPMNPLDAGSASEELPSCTLGSVKVPFEFGKGKAGRATILIKGLQSGWHPLVLSESSKEGELAQSQIQVLVPETAPFPIRFRIPLCLGTLLLLGAILMRIRKGF